MSRRQPFEPIPDDIEKQEPRTQRAYREPMQVALARAGGRYTVYAASGNTYEVDVIAKTCTCGDSQQNEPDGGCKHVRRVDMEVRANRVPTPDGRLPTPLMMDGGIVATCYSERVPVSTALHAVCSLRLRRHAVHAGRESRLLSLHLPRIYDE